MKVIVGLGNPGSQYNGTRHNVGFMTVEELARRHGSSTGDKPKSKYDAEILEITLPDKDGNPEKVLLVEPMTFMNLSGKTVRPLADFYNLDPDQFLVICDDMNLDSGRLRLKPSGSAGGQNGLSHILQVMGTNDVPRLRIGIGRPPGKMSASAWVLGKFTKQEQETIEFAIGDAADGVELWCREPIDRAMNVVNSPKEQ